MSTTTTHIDTEKQLVPTLRFNEFGELINESRFGEVVESNIYGPRFNANDYSDVGNVRTIRGTDLGSDGEIKYEQVPLALLDEKMVNTHKLQDGDIVMITTAECGATGVFRKQDIDYLSSAYGVRIRLNEQGFPYYFKYFFQTWQAKKEINSYIRKATVANLPGSDILRIKLYKPSLPEQQKIASFLSAVDEKIQQLTKKKALLEQYKKGVMQQLFSGQLRFKDENGNPYPDWEEKLLDDVANIKRGASPRPISDPKWFDEDSNIGWVRISDVTKSNKYLEKTTQYLTKEGVSKSRLIETGSMIMSICATIGKPIYTKFEVCIHDGFVVFEDLQADKEFLYYYLDKIQLQWYRYGQPGSQVNLNTTIVGNETMPFPCLEEQQKIATYLSSIDTKIESVKIQITQTQTFKKGLLQQMFV